MCLTSTEIMNVVEFVTRKLSNEGIQYVFTGSVSSMIQGCEITPGDIDLLVAEPIDVQRVVLALNEFLINDIISEDNIISVDSWVATKAEPLKEYMDFANNKWTFSRLIVEGVKLEIANIRPSFEKEYISGTGFWENGPHVWQFI
jgi:hypothetical protein